MGNKYQAGVAGVWLNESGILKAAKAVRDAGFETVDAVTPYAVHGMEEALQIRRSNIPYWTFVAGFVGCSFGLWFTWWTSAVNWATNIGGKPFFSLPAFIPIIFELTILCAALTSVFALFRYCGLPKFDPPVIDKDITSHKFALFVGSSDKNYNEAKLVALMNQLGASEVKKMAEY